FEIVAMIRLASIRVTLLQSLGDTLSNGASPSSIRVLPGKTIVFTRRADNPLCILAYFGIVMLFHGIFVLRLHVSATNLDGIQFIGTDTPEEDFLAARLGVESPLAHFFDERDRKWPLIVANG